MFFEGWEAEVGRFWVHGRPGLQGEPKSQKHKTNNKKLQEFEYSMQNGSFSYILFRRAKLLLCCLLEKLIPSFPVQNMPTCKKSMFNI